MIGSIERHKVGKRKAITWRLAQGSMDVVD